MSALAAALLLTVPAACGDDDSEGEPLPADPEAIAAAAATAMGEVTSVRFDLSRTGAPVYIDPVEALRVDHVEGRYSAPSSADAVLTVTVNDSLRTRLGAVAIDETVWLSNPVTGEFEPLAAGYDLDPSTFFDPMGGWRPLLADLEDVELVGEVDRDGPRYHLRGVAPADRVEAITAGLIDDQDVEIDLWVRRDTGLVGAVEFTTIVGGDATTWVLELGDYGGEFTIEPPAVDD